MCLAGSIVPLSILSTPNPEWRTICPPGFRISSDIHERPKPLVLSGTPVMRSWEASSKAVQSSVTRDVSAGLRCRERRIPMPPSEIAHKKLFPWVASRNSIRPYAPTGDSACWTAFKALSEKTSDTRGRTDAEPIRASPSRKSVSLASVTTSTGCLNRVTGNTILDVAWSGTGSSSTSIPASLRTL